MTPNQVGLALLLLGLVLLVGKAIRMKVRWVQSLFLPSAIIAGFLALLAGPEVLGQALAAAGVDALADGGLFGADTLAVWKSLPGMLISVVFATLFLGQRLPGPRTVVDLAGPQLSVGVAFAAGQYVVGLLLAVTVLGPLLGLPPMAGALIEIGFEGGHGTAAGMIPVFEEVNWPEGADLAIAVATVGLVGGIVIGVAVINWAIRTGRTEVVRDVYEQSIEEQRGLFGKDEQYTAGVLTSRPASIEPLSLHMSFVALAIIIGQLMLSGLQWVEQRLWADTVELLAYVPLFPLAMLGGIALQLGLNAAGWGHLIDPGLMLRIQGFALDVLIVAALATISLEAIASNMWAFLLLCAGGIVLNVVLLLWLVPRTIPSFWLERGIGDFGQSMGVTATGLVLMRIVDPEAKSPCFEAFGYKQLVFEPFFGGGLITAIAVPLVFQFGPWPLLGVMGVLFLGSLAVSLLYWGRKTTDAAAIEVADVTPDHVGPGDGAG